MGIKKTRSILLLTFATRNALFFLTLKPVANLTLCATVLCYKVM